MNKIKKISALLLSLVMTLSLISVYAADTDITIVKDDDPSTFNWNAEEVAYIDFSEMTEISLTEGAEGNGITLLPNNGATSWKAANRLSADGYMLLGKESNTDGNNPEKTDIGHIYIKLDKSLQQKANTPYTVKIDYYGGGSGTIDSGSYITLYYKSATANEANIKKTYGSTYNSGKTESMYFKLDNANFGENIGTPKGDIRLTTYNGAQLKIRRISILEYTPTEYPTLKKVKKGSTDEVAFIDFSKLGDIPTGEVVDGGNGLSLVTNVSTGNRRSADIIENGYLLLGAESHTNADNTKSFGYAYLKLNTVVEEKQNTPYAVKIEYFGGGVKLDSGSYIDVYNNGQSGNAAYSRKTLGSTYNSGKMEAFYYLLPNADFTERFNGADIRLDVYTGQQFKIRKISVVKYDPDNAPATDADKEYLFAQYSEGALPANKVVVNANTGEYAGIQYKNSNVAALDDANGNRSFAVQPMYDSNNLGTLGFVIDSDDIVKSAKKSVITVSYWDIGTGDFNIEYNSDNSNYEKTNTVIIEDTKQIKTVSFTLDNTAFGGKQTGGYDFKLLTRTPDFCVVKVEVTAVVEGDVNQDGILNSNDLAELRTMLLNGESIFDINSDEVFDVRDLVTLNNTVDLL